MADFGAFVELEPGIEGLAHASAFAPTGGAGGWTKQVAVGFTGAFKILTIDTAQKRIGVALVEEGGQPNRTSTRCERTPNPGPPLARWPISFGML